MRRATFRDVPLLRMRSVTVSQESAPFALPERRIEILLVAGGSFDALTHTVLVHVGAAELVEGEERRRLAPFDVVETRTVIARSITGAAGPPLRYPGVVCSREGQELYVESWAPDLLTEWR